MKSNEIIGRIVQSTAGRDAGKYFIVIGVVDANYVLISDGRLRTEEKPKKKKLKHLVVTDKVEEEIRNNILDGKKVTNSMIKKVLQLKDIDKEV